MKLFFSISAVLCTCLFVSCQNKIQVSVSDYADPKGYGYEVNEGTWGFVKEEMKDTADIKVSQSVDPQYRAKLKEAAAAGTLADVVYLWPQNMTDGLYDQRLVKDLSPLLDTDFKSHFCTPALEGRFQRGGILGELPSGISASCVLFVNQKLLASLGLKPAKTYAELKAQVPKIRAAGLDTVLIDTKDPGVFQMNLFSALAGRLAGNGFIDALAKGEAKFTDKPFVDTLRFVRTMVLDGVIRPEQTHGYSDIPKLFIAGKAPYYIDGDWNTVQLEGLPFLNAGKFAPDVQESLEVAVFPRLGGEAQDAGDTSVGVGAGWGISASIKAGSAKEKAAVEIIKLLQGPEAQAMRLSNRSSFPSRTDAGSSNLSSLGKKRVALYKDLKGSYNLTDKFDGPTVTALNSALHDILFGKDTPEAAGAKIQAAAELQRKATKVS